MKKYSLLLLFPLLFVVGCTQEDEVLFFEQISVNEIKQKEISIAKVYEGYSHGTLAKSLYPQSEVLLDQSLLTVRKLKMGLPLKTKYYFSDTDSLVKFVIYEWNVVTPEMTKEEIDKHTLNNLAYHQDYVSKFNALAQRYTELYGNPDEGNGVLQKEKFQNLERNYSTYKWELEDKVVSLSISLIPTLSYRVTTKVYWK